MVANGHETKQQENYSGRQREQLLTNEDRIQPITANYRDTNDDNNKESLVLLRIVNSLLTTISRKRPLCK